MRSLLDDAMFDIPRTMTPLTKTGEGTEAEQTGAQTRDAGPSLDVKAQQPEPETATTIYGPILVTTKTCPNCAAAKKALTDAGFEYRVVYAEEDDGAEIATKFNVTAAPTLIVPSEAGPEIYGSISGVNRFLRKMK